MVVLLQIRRAYRV